MAKEKRSHVRRGSGGCFGCLTRILVLLGLAALLFVGACFTGIIRNDTDGRPVLSLGDVSLPELPSVGEIRAGTGGFSLPGWAYNLNAEGLTVKALRAGKGGAGCRCVCAASTDWMRLWPWIRRMKTWAAWLSR